LSLVPNRESGCYSIYGSAHCSAISRGQSAAQKGAAADESAKVIRRAEITMRAQVRKTLSRTQAAQAPACPGRLGHGAAGDVHDLVGEARDQQPNLIAAEGVHRRGRGLQLLAATMRFRPVGRRQRRGQNVFQLTHGVVAELTSET
jgi:hypothetical protein